MRTVTLTAKCRFKNEFFRAGTVIEVTDAEYVELLASGVIAEERKDPKDLKEKKKDAGKESL